GIAVNFAEQRHVTVMCAFPRAFLERETITDDAAAGRIVANWLGLRRGEATAGVAKLDPRRTFQRSKHGAAGFRSAGRGERRQAAVGREDLHREAGIRSEHARSPEFQPCLVKLLRAQADPASRKR